MYGGGGGGWGAEVGHDFAIGAFVVEDADVILSGFCELRRGGGTWMKSISVSQWRAPLLRRIGVVIGIYYRAGKERIVGKGLERALIGVWEFLCV